MKIYKNSISVAAESRYRRYPGKESYFFKLFIYKKSKKADNCKKNNPGRTILAELTKEQIKNLKKLAHSLKPVILVGKNGKTPELLGAVARELDNHELIKIKFGDFKEERHALGVEIAQACAAELVSLIGNVLTLYKQNPDVQKRSVSI